jgi:hypothetical protein
MYTRETGRRIKFIQPQTACSTAANTISIGQATTNMKKGDFCTIMCTTGKMWFLNDTLETTLSAATQNGWEMISGDSLDFVAASSYIQTLSTAVTSGYFQMIVWDV